MYLSFYVLARINNTFFHFCLLSSIRNQLKSRKNKKKKTKIKTFLVQLLSLSREVESFKGIRQRSRNHQRQCIDLHIYSLRLIAAICLFLLLLLLLLLSAPHFFVFDGRKYLPKSKRFIALSRIQKSAMTFFGFSRGNHVKLESPDEILRILLLLDSYQIQQ